MRPYLLINGKNSKTIHGLLIQSLPSISKPKIRTETETIDGRDGEIITPLGYEAYNKVVSIGLKDNFDIDEVISFFDSEGIVTFSDEPEKYYRFGIYEQIDFNRLIRYRTANVTFRVQPFKYSLVEPDLSYESPSGETVRTIFVNNIGNIKSRPKLTITGKGQINISINNKHVLLLDLWETDQTVIIDPDEMNAFDAEGNLVNRRITGDYNDVAMLPGVNNVYVTGHAKTVKFERYSRWI